MSIPNPHDRLFRAAFSEPRYAAELFRMVLPPDLAQILDLGSLRREETSFVDERLAACSCDLLFKLEYADSPITLYLLCEHQSHPDRRMLLRMLQYGVRVQIRHLEAEPGGDTPVPAVIPIVVHHGAGGWRGPRRMLEAYDLPSAIAGMLQPLVPDFGFVLKELGDQSLAALRAQEMTARTTLVLWCLGNAQRLMDASGEDEVVGRLREVRDLMVQVLDTPGGGDALGIVWRYILEVTNVPPERLRALLEPDLDPRVLEELMTASEQIRREGWEDCQRATLSKQLEQRFGPLPEEAKRRIQLASGAQLDTWIERVVTAQSLDEIFAA